METIATDALLLVTARYREAADRGPQHGMERRIETSDLHQARSKRKQRSCRRQARLLVQRRHRGQARQFVDGLARCTGATNCDPPCTMRCPTAARPPLPAFWSVHSRISFRMSACFRGAGQSRSRTLLPCMSLTVKCGLWPVSEISPANRYTGLEPVRSNRPNLILEDPAFKASMVLDIGGTWSDGWSF